jgi:predicted TIM-barrel fold metal-dependent hydrolase
MLPGTRLQLVLPAGVGRRLDRPGERAGGQSQGGRCYDDVQIYELSSSDANYANMIGQLVQVAPIATTQTHTVRRAKHAAIDFHAHLGRWLAPEEDWVASDLAGRHDRAWMVADVGAFLELLDAHNVAASVNLDGRWNAELEANLDRYDRAHPGRFFTFCQLDFRLAGERDDFGEELARSLRASAAAGARGLKVWKTLGLGFRDVRGDLLLPDDPRLAPVFAAAGELGLPVLIHTADPVAFFQPADDGNERLAELRRHPEWSYHGTGFPTHGRLMESFEELVAAHPGTTFVGAHVAGWVENLDWVSRMLDDHPNLHVDFAARLPDLGRQAHAARRLILRHPGRVLFGTDELPPSAAGYRRYFRFLETADEGYRHAEELPPPTGSWTVSALDLPDDALRAVYAENAARLLKIDLESDREGG